MRQPYPVCAMMSPEIDSSGLCVNKSEAQCVK